MSRLGQLLGGSPCTPFPTDWKLSTSAATALPGSGAPRSLTLVSNRTTSGPLLEQILVRAKLQLLSRAYMHHFETYGVEADFISERAELVQQVVDGMKGCGARSGLPPRRGHPEVSAHRPPPFSSRSSSSPSEPP